MSSPDGLRKLAAILLTAPAALLLGIFCLGPLVLLLRVSLFAPAAGRGFYQPSTWAPGNYSDLVNDGYFRDVLLFTLLLGAGVTLLVLILAYPLALFIHGLSPRAKTVALAAVVMPKFASMLVTVYGLQALLSGSGPVNRFLVAVGLSSEPLTLTRNLTGVVIGETYLLLPYAVLVLVLALARIDAGLVVAAHGLGASRLQAFRRVTLPLSLPGVAMAGQLTLVWALSAFVGPLLLGGPGQVTLAVEVHRQAVEHNRWPLGAATAVILLFTFSFVLSVAAMLRPRSHA
ncbi:MAG TPA: ABC transporter permease [Gemmataceae bacterium]|nr:ABC transporter permease [Gemmataceae bacterium]